MKLRFVFRRLEWGSLNGLVFRPKNWIFDWLTK